MKLISKNDIGVMSALGVGALKGVITDLTNNEYHSLKAYTSSTALKYMCSLSPAHYKAMYIDQSIEQKKPTDKMILGSLVHCLILTPDQFENEYFIMPDLNLRTNEGKAQRDHMLEANPNKMMIDQEMLDQANKMKDACLKNTEATNLLKDTKKEYSFFWQCPFSNISMRARADASSSKYLVELKTTSDASKDFFSRHIFNMNYDLSLHHYLEGIRITMDVAPPQRFIVIEDKPPYVTQVYKVGSSIMELGQQKWLDAVTKLECGLKKNEWPGYFPVTEEGETIEAPSWAMSKSNLVVEADDDIF